MILVAPLNILAGVPTEPMPPAYGQLAAYKDFPVIRKLEVRNDLRINVRQAATCDEHSSSFAFPGLDGLGLSLELDLELKDRNS